MDPFEKEFHTKSREVRLSAHEKDAIRASVLPRAGAPISSPYALYVLPALRGVAIALSLVIVAAGPITYGAQKSAPGDLLYAFEVGVVEEVEQSLRFSPASKHAYHTERLEERLAELRARDGRPLPPEESETVIGDIAVHAQAAAEEGGAPKEQVSRLARTAALLAAHEEVMTDAKLDDRRIEELADAIDQQLADRTEDYVESETDTELASAIAEKLDRTDDLLDAVKSRNDFQDFTERFEDIADDVEDGRLERAYEDATALEVDLLTEGYLKGAPEED